MIGGLALDELYFGDIEYRYSFRVATGFHFRNHEFVPAVSSTFGNINALLIEIYDMAHRLHNRKHNGILHQIWQVENLDECWRMLQRAHVGPIAKHNFWNQLLADRKPNERAQHGRQA